MHLGHRLPLRRGEGRIWQCLCPAGIDRVTRRPKKPKNHMFSADYLCFVVVNGIVLKFQHAYSTLQNLDLGSGKIHEDPVFSCQHVLQFPTQ